MQEKNSEMTIENFHKILKFHKNNNINELRIIGGEPTLHSKFKDFLYLASTFNVIEEVLIFTNGLMSDDVVEFLIKISKKFKKGLKCMINYNGHDLKDSFFFEKLLTNSLKLNKNNLIVTFGLNFYKPDINYFEVLDLTETFGLKNLRVSVPAPHNYKTKNFDAKIYYESFRDTFYSFVLEAFKKNIFLEIDCNAIPSCIFTNEQKKMLSLCSFSKKSCSTPTLDVTPELDVLKCFGCSDISVKSFDFENDSLENLFNKINDKSAFLLEKKYFVSCDTCDVFKFNNTSCVCHAFIREEKKCF